MNRAPFIVPYRGTPHSKDANDQPRSVKATRAYSQNAPNGVRLKCRKGPYIRPLTAAHLVHISPTTLSHPSVVLVDSQRKLSLRSEPGLFVIFHFLCSGIAGLLYLFNAQITLAKFTRDIVILSGRCVVRAVPPLAFYRSHRYTLSCGLQTWGWYLYPR